MTDAQKLQIAAATARKELRALALQDDATAGAIGEATKKVDDLEARAAILQNVEDGENGPDRVTTEDAEARERRALRGKVHLGDYLDAAQSGRGVHGAAGEFNQHLEIGAERFPLELLEERALTGADGAVVQGTWLDRVFENSAGMALGVSFKTVQPGQISFPVTTAGATAAQRGRTEDAVDAPWTVGVTNIEPTPNRVRAVFSRTDALRLPGLEDSIRRDLRAALKEGIDRAIFEGDAGASEDDADIVGFTTATGVTEVELTQTNKVKWPQTVKAFTDMIDGRYAASPEDLRIVATVGAARLWLATTANSNRNESVAQVMRGNGLSWGVRGGIEATTTNNKFGAFIGLGRGIEGAAVAAVWSDAELIRDPYTKGASGQISLTLATNWGFKICRAANFARLKFVTG